MILTYNGFSLSDLGEMTISQKRTFEGGDAPQRSVVTLEVKISLFQQSYADNYDLIQQAADALSTPNAVLEWTNDVTDETYINQTVTLTSEDFPEEWGTYFQELNLSFFYYENLDTSNQNLPLVFTVDGGAAFTFDRVTAWTDGMTTERFSPFRSNRRSTIGRVDVQGIIVGDPTQPLATRRAALATQVTALRASMNSAQGNLVFGSGTQLMFSNEVRITDFKAQLDQVITQIKFSFSASYTLFPDEDDYATVTANIEEKNNFTGENTLSLSGKIEGTSEAIGRTKLGVIVASVLAQYGYAKNSQALEFNVTPNLISANADGVTFTELTFSASWRKWRASNQVATFCATGNKTPISFGNVKLWEDGYRADRFDVQRSERRTATGTVSATGTYAGDSTLSLTDRRAALLALQRRMKQECNNAEGTLVFGTWSQVVRIEDFVAHVNQAETGIDWAFTASYSMFPNEGGYATCDFSADARGDVESGDYFLTFAGEILAPNGSLARAKLGSLRAAVLGIYGFTLNQQTKAQSATRDISANGDETSTVPEGIETEGDVADVSFLRLTFNEEYRQRMPGTVLNSNYTITSNDDTTSGLLVTTYAGTVVATGANADAAMAAAIARAMVIGANKQQAIDPTAFLKSQSMTIEWRQTSPTLAEEFVRLQFSYEYQSKMTAGRAYVEVNTATLNDAFGTDSETVSGFVVAVNFTVANLIYQQQVRAAYATSLIRQETVTQNEALSEVPSLTAPATDTMTFNTQQIRLQFQFQAHLDKAAGEISARYAINVQRDFRSMKLTTRLHGSVYALDRSAAETFITALTTPMGQLMDSSREESRDHSSVADVFTKFDFDDMYETRLTGIAGVIEMQVTETVTYSATRWAVQPIPFSSNGGNGVSIPQAAGLTEGSRVVRGWVSSASKATAMAWATRHQGMLTGDNSGTFCPQQPVIETINDFAPRVDGIAEDGLAGANSVANVQIYKVNFTFSEILPNYLPAF